MYGQDETAGDEPAIRRANDQSLLLGRHRLDHPARPHGEKVGTPATSLELSKRRAPAAGCAMSRRVEFEKM
jgi:hypothetical protein